jgi:hypothetical protein
MTTWRAHPRPLRAWIDVWAGSRRPSGTDGLAFSAKENTSVSQLSALPTDGPSLASPIHTGGTLPAHKPWSSGMQWAREELNLRPLPCQQAAGKRCANGRCRRSALTDGTWQRLLVHAQTRSDPIGESTWRDWSTRQSCGPTSTRPAPERGARPATRRMAATSMRRSVKR